MRTREAAAGAPRDSLRSAARATLVVAAALALAWSGPAAAAKKPLGPAERIDLNRASKAELMRLPGVGAGRAQAILAQRARRPFRRPEDVLHVKGLGRKWFARVKAHVTTGGASSGTAATASGGAPAGAPPGTSAAAATARR